MDKKTLEKAKDLEFISHQLKSMVAILREEKEDPKDPFFGNLGTLTEMPKEIKDQVAVLLKNHQIKMEKELEEM